MRRGRARVAGAALAFVAVAAASGSGSLLVAAPAGASATTCTWTGGGSSLHWSDTANWDCAGGPASGDTLVFPSGKSGTFDDDLSGLTGVTLDIQGNPNLTGDALGVVGVTNSASGSDIGIQLALVVAAGTTIDDAGSANLDLSGGISGAGPLTLAGTGQIIVGADTVTGDTTVTGAARVESSAPTSTPFGNGTLVIAGGQAAYTEVGAASTNVTQPVLVTASGTLADENDDSWSGAVSVDSGAVLALDNQYGAGPFTLSGAVSGEGGLALDSTDLDAGTPTTVVVSGQNTYSGGTTASVGEIEASSSSALGTGAVTVDSGASLALDGGVTLSTDVTVAGTGVNGTGALLGTGGIAEFGGNLTLTGDTSVATSGTLVLAGSVSGSYGLEMAGTGTVALAQSGGVVGSLQVDAGATFESRADLSVATGVSFASGATWLVDQGALGGGTAVNVNSGSGTVSVGGADLVLTGTFVPSDGYADTLLSDDGSSPESGTFNGLPEGGTFTNNGVTWTATYLGNGGHDLVLTASGPPGSPFDLTATASPYQPGTATLGWWAPTSGTAPTGYTVISNPTCDTCAGLTTSGATGTTVTGLPPGWYEFAVVATGPGGTSASASNWSSQVLVPGSCTWTGGGTDLLWSDSANWTGSCSGGGVPGSGDTVVLGPGGSGTSDNDLPGLTDVNLDLEPGVSHPSGDALGVAVVGATASVELGMPLELDGTARVFVDSGDQLVVPSFSGTGELDESGPGALVVDDDTASGGTVISGTVQVEGSISTVTPLGSGTVTLNGGSLDLVASPAPTTSIIEGLDVTTSGTLIDANPGGWSGDIALAPDATLSIDDTGGLFDVAGTVSGTGHIAVGGTLGLTGSNTYAGGTTVTTGRLEVGGDDSLGTGPVLVDQGATLDLVGSVRVPNNVTLAGVGSSDQTAALEATGDATLAGTLGLDGDSTVASRAGSLTLAGDITGGHQLDVVSGTVVLGGGAYVGSLLVEPAATFVSDSTLTVDAGLQFGAGATWQVDPEVGIAAEVLGGQAGIQDAVLVVAGPERPAAGVPVTLIWNRDGAATSGTFRQLPEGSTFAQDGVSWTITYTGNVGDGAGGTTDTTDVVLHASGPPGPATQPYVSAGSDDTQVSWNPPTTGTTVATYTVVPSPACPTCTGLTIPGDASTITDISGLANGTLYTFTVLASGPGGVGPPSPPSPPARIPDRDPGGYWLVGADGGVFTFGGASFYGSMGGKPLNAPVVAMARTPSAGGYWEVASDGGVFAFGDAGFYGSEGGKPLNAPIVGMAATPDGGGYWLVAADGGVFAFGDAGFYGSEGGKPLNAPIVGMAATADGLGYYLAGSDGGVFTFGDAAFYGSMGGKPLNAPMVAIAETPDGLGYYLVGSDGGVFTFGDAGFYGSEGGKPLNAPIVGMLANPVGYWLVAADGGVFTFGYRPFEGSEGGKQLNAPIVAMSG